MFNFSKKKLNKFRLLVETDRWHNVSRADRLYHRRNSDDRRDEFHNIMSCYSSKARKGKYLPSSCCNNITFNQLYYLCKSIKIINTKQRETILIKTQHSSTDFRKEGNFGAKGDNSYIKPNNLQLTSEKRVISDQRETILI